MHWTKHSSPVYHFDPNFTVFFVWQIIRWQWQGIFNLLSLAVRCSYLSTLRLSPSISPPPTLMSSQLLLTVYRITASCNPLGLYRVLTHSSFLRRPGSPGKRDECRIWEIFVNLVNCWPWSPDIISTRSDAIISICRTMPVVTTFLPPQSSLNSGEGGEGWGVVRFTLITQSL